MWPGVLFPNNIGGLPHTEITIAELLKERGYQTALAGKWHLGIADYLPTTQGFDHYFGIPYSHDMGPFFECYPGEECDLASPHASNVAVPLYANDSITEQPVDLTSLTPRLAHWTTQFVNNKTREKVPYFLMYSFHHVHFPQFASRAWRNSSVRGSFGDSVLEVDWAMGELLDALRQTQSLDDTIIVFTSDNGPRLRNQGKAQAGDAGMFKCGKGTTWEGGQRVPAILHWPARVAPGTYRDLASFLDILPTLVSLVDGGTEGLPSVWLDGYDLSKSIINNEPSPRNHFLYVHPNLPGINALRHKNFKAHFRTLGALLSVSENDPDCSKMVPSLHSPPLLFDLESDPAERFELSGDAAYLDIIKEMMILKDIYEGDLNFAPSQQLNFDSNIQPCCDPGCQPFPTCCTCK